MIYILEITWEDDFANTHHRLIKAFTNEEKASKALHKLLDAVDTVKEILIPSDSILSDFSLGIRTVELEE